MAREYINLSGHRLTATSAGLMHSGSAGSAAVAIAHTGANRTIIAFQTADQTIINAATLTGANLSFPVVNGDRWQFEMGLFTDCGAGGIRVAVSGAAATSFVAATNLTSGAHVSGVGSVVVNLPGAGSSLVHVVGTVQPSADGTYYPQFGQFASNSAATVLKQGSYLKATRLL